LFSRARIAFTDWSQDERAKMAPVPQVLVRTHPRSGRKSLFLSSHAGRIRGMEEPEARVLLMDLIEHATQREFVYTHRWTVADLVMWDNPAPCTARGNMTKRRCEICIAPPFQTALPTVADAA
jgi:alpha-ketoglutarate-dependent 2,4-dichlorophenoxyacetate dioxygenase